MAPIVKANPEIGADRAGPAVVVRHLRLDDGPVDVRVEGVDHRRVALRDEASPQLSGAGHLLVVRVELLVQDEELADLRAAQVRVLLDAAVHAHDLGVDEVVDLGLLGEVRVARVREVPPLRPVADGGERDGAAGEPAALDVLRQVEEEVRELPLRPRRVLETDHHAREDVLPDARRREEVRRADLLEVGTSRCRCSLGAAHGEADEDRLRVREEVVPDPRHRQVREHLLVGAQPLLPGAGRAGEDEVPVGEHHALRRAGGPGGVNASR